MKALPERGRIGIFNRSYYEDVLVVRVHPEILTQQKLPPGKRGRQVLGGALRRHQPLRAAPRRNGTLVLKFFLQRLEEGAEEALPGAARATRTSTGSSRSPISKERGFWDDYQKAFEDMLQHTSTKWAPWWVIPADHKWVTRALVGGIITTESIRRLGLKRPAVTTEQQRLLARARRQLLAEKK